MEKDIDLEAEPHFNISSEKNESISRAADIEPGLRLYDVAEDGSEGRAPKSEALFSMYLERADANDNKVIERWKKETDGILIFAGIFSVALAVLLTVSIQDLRPKPQDTSAFYLANIYHVLANTSTSQAVVLPRLADPPVFSPPGYALWVNTLWSLSLVMSFGAALLAIFVQQWTHSYIRATPAQERHSPRTRAQIHTFYNNGLNRFHFATTVTLAPLLIHTSLILFFAGFPVWLININRTVGLSVISWLVPCVFGYAFVTLLPIFRPDSPYYSPLSSSIWRFTVNVRNAVSRLFPPLRLNLPWLSSSLHTASLRFALAFSKDSIYRSLLWTFLSLQQDNELEQFYDAIPDLCASDGKPPGNFIIQHKKILGKGLVELMDRTFSSNLVSEPVRLRRISICTEVLRATDSHLLGPHYFLRRVLRGEWQYFLGSVSVGLFVQSWKDIADNTGMFYAQCVVSAVIATAPMHDKPWIQLVIRHLAVSESTLQDYLDNGQSVLLANLNYLVWRIIRVPIESVRERYILESLDVLESIRKFDVRGTLPVLQHQFCGLWNQLISRECNDTSSATRAISVGTLKQIHKVYIALHQDADPVTLAFAAKYGGDSAPDDVTSYPSCTIHGRDPVQTVSMSPSSATASGSRFATSPTFPGSSSTIPQITVQFPTPSPSPSRVTEEASGTGNTSEHVPIITGPTPSLPFIPSITTPRASEAGSDTGGNVSSLATTSAVAIPALDTPPGLVASLTPDQAHVNVDPLSRLIQAHLHVPDETHSRM